MTAGGAACRAYAGHTRRATTSPRSAPLIGRNSVFREAWPVDAAQSGRDSLAHASATGEAAHPCRIEASGEDRGRDAGQAEEPTGRAVGTDDGHRGRRGLPAVRLDVAAVAARRPTSHAVQMRRLRMALRALAL